MAFLGLKIFDGNDLTNWARAVTNVVNGIMKGKINTTGTVTLTSSATSTTVHHSACSANSAVFLYPITTAAAGVVTSTYVTPGDESFVVTHTSLTTTRKFAYVILG